MFNFQTNTESHSYTWKRGTGSASCDGTIGGGTFSLEVSYDNGGTWNQAGDKTLTAPGTINFDLPDCHIRTKLAGATGPNLDAYIRPITGDAYPPD